MSNQIIYMIQSYEYFGTQPGWIILGYQGDVWLSAGHVVV